MAWHPLTFAEVLQDEYRYFYGDANDEPFGQVQFELKHVREIDGLSRFLRSMESDACDGSSKWHILRKAVGKYGFDVSAAIVKALNDLLTERTLLDQLANDDAFVERLASSPDCLRLLLGVPEARRLLLEQRKLSSVVSDDDLIDEFASRSAAIRILIDRYGFRSQFRARPELLSIVADDRALHDAIVSKDEELLAQRPKGWRGLVARVRHLFGLASAATAAMEKILSGAKEPSIAAVHLSRFNALLIETAYAEYVSDSQSEGVLHAAMFRRETAALCLSGGGIRSATFNLGILQGLADHRLLNRFQYLSTVSGGGYVGSWLSSWTRRHREGAVGVAKDLSREPVDPAHPEVKPIEYLRQYSSYLAPRNTAFSLDVWTIVATYLRNLFLNWTLLLPFLVAVFAIPRVLEAAIRDNMLTVLETALVKVPVLGTLIDMLHGVEELIRGAKSAESDIAGLGVILCGLVAAIMIGSVRPYAASGERQRHAARWTLWSWLLPLLVSAILFCVSWASPHNMFFDDPKLLVRIFGFGAAAASAVLAVLTAWKDVVASVAPGRSVAAWLRDAAAFVGRLLRRLGQSIVLIFFAGLSGAVGGFLLDWFFRHAFPREILREDAWLEVYACLGIPLFLSAFFLAITLLVGLNTSFARDYDREWWARSSAAILVSGAGYAVGACAVIIVPIVIFQRPELAAPVGGISGIVSYLASRGLDSATSKEETRKRLLLPLLRVGAGVTLIFIIACISIVTTSILGVMNGRMTGLSAPLEKPPWLDFCKEFIQPATWNHLVTLRTTALVTLFLLMAAAWIIAASMSLLINVNVYSMHGMYRNRLIRAYLGASRWLRRPDPFTGFDPQDNVKMYELRPEMLWPTSVINFDRFVAQLQQAGPLWEAMDADVRNRVCAYSGAKGAERRKMRDTARTVVVNEINRLMLCRDLRYNVRAKASLELLRANRKFIEASFPKTVRTFDREVYLPDHHSVVGQAPAGKLPAPLPVSGRPPLHVLNTALNLVHGRNLAWQERKADSFTISPLHCGNRLVGYRDSAVYADQISLGSAMAISGAAVSPNMGSKSSPAFTCLMTLLNMRLGCWIGNPKKKTFRKKSPQGIRLGRSIDALLSEALGQTDENDDFIFLSDGGHFDNLGLYEMVKRRCKFIVVCDATADGKYAFGDLANAVRKIRIDLGVSIEPLVTKYIGPEAGEEYGKYCAIGDIRYGALHGEHAVGKLLYIKPCVYSDCPADVRNYRRNKEAFPHETTADQFFSESQFESYRALGRYIIGRISGDKPDQSGPWIAHDVNAFFNKAENYVSGKRPPIGDRVVNSMSDVVDWMSARIAET